MFVNLSPLEQSIRKKKETSRFFVKLEASNYLLKLFTLKVPTSSSKELETKLRTGPELLELPERTNCSFSHVHLGAGQISAIPSGTPLRKKGHKNRDVLRQSPREEGRGVGRRRKGRHLSPSAPIFTILSWRNQ
jgi:hypothetical protein